MATFRLCALPSRRRIESTVGLSNRSGASSNRVSCIKIRISKIRVQRLAHEIGWTLPKIKKMTPQRLGTVRLTAENLGSIFVTRTCPAETGLVGWGERTRTHESRDARKQKRGFNPEMRGPTSWQIPR